MIKAISHKIAVFALIVIMLVGVVLSATPIVAFAATSETDYSQTNVLDDLKSSTVNGEPFDIKDYPYNESGSIQIINFVEYCYSYKANMQDNYGLYIYVYNPQGLNLSDSTKQNKIQMAVSYDANGNPTRYEKFNLELCNKSEGDYKNLFFKYKVVDRKIDNKTFADRVNSNERRYDVSGVELLTYGDKNATEYGVGGTYKFTGYAAGYGADTNAKSTLMCVVEDLETLELKVYHTNFRTNVSSLGPDHYNEVNTVYFAVPERIFNTYGNLQKIRAEWWEYKTKMAAITSNYDYYQNTLLKYVGTYTGEHNSSVDNFLYSGYSGQSGQGYCIHNFDWTYNKSLETQSSLLMVQTYFSKKVSDMMPYAFYSPAVDVDSVFKFLYSDPIAGDVDSTQVQEWIYNYSNNLGNGYIDCNGRQISKDLFEDSVDPGRTMGYNDKTIDLSDTFDLNSYDSNHSWWDKLWDYGFSWPATNGDYQNVAPIYEVKAADLTGSDSDIASRLLVNSDDVSHLKEFYDKEVANGNRVILFRFANTDYYCAPAFAPHTENITKTDTYVAQQTVFLDFDIIELTFNKDGVYHVIPVVASPTDIVNGFTQPPAQFQWWKVVLAVILLILLIILLAPILPTILGFIINIIILPFKLIGSLFKSIKSKRKEKKQPKTDAEAEERYKKVMREDFPRDFADEDPFTSAMLDDLDKK